MTELRPAYLAFSSTTEEHTAQHSLVSSPLHQYYTDGTLSRDHILLLPILHSVQSDEEPSACMHLIHLPNGRLSLCNTLTEHSCPCCGNSVCYEHESKCCFTLPSGIGISQEEDRMFLCETCARLPRDVRVSLYAFRMAINEVNA